MIYFDNHTATQPSQKTIESMQPYLREQFACSSAPHRLGQSLHGPMKEAYQSLYELLGADPEATVIFTSSGTEAVNHVIQSVYFDVTRETGRNHFLTSSVDEAAAIMTIGRLEQMGCSGKMAAVDEFGALTADAVADSITPRTALVSISWANGLTGVVNHVVEISELCRERGILLHLDASHVAGRLPIDLQEVQADFISLDGSRMHGPRGSGALYIRSGMRLSPYLLGGADQGGHRAGSVDVASLVGLGHAAKEAMSHLDHVGMETARLCSRLESLLCENGRPQVCFARSERLPTTTTIVFPGVVNDALLFLLAQKELYAGFGGGSFQRLALVLEASGYTPELSNTALTFTLSRDTTEDEVEYGAKLILECYEELCRTSERLCPSGGVE